ncbi:hypothetical protein AVP43_00814 [Geobacillus stearothermophilus]|uniref:hypothetical protein n=1 Tax=Geobacillus sp. DSP4a TaxID=2508873 RepID=UPI00067D21CB|nr:hypothetical protein [Geobacillus sp. DSP4a]AKU27190.1 hypothetical protein IB49_13185 [Geobacillus sp. LC300]KZE97278.1 hypothetical protein AVP43_00814 [Geobacillus stearothermophilus]NNU98977.1 hypothetical protein [Geobacillus sp. DSP4a]
MIRYWKLLFSLAVAFVLLVGCGTKEHETTQAAKEEQTAADQKPSSDAPSSKNPSPSKEAKEQTSTKKNEEEQRAAGGGQPAASQPTISLSYQDGNQTVTKTATLQTSNNQHFSLYVLEGWTLDAEEPGADVLLHGEAFARIRLLSEGETNYEQLAQEHAQAVDANAAHQQTNGLPKPFADAVWYTAQADGATVHVIASAQPAPMLLTVHAPRNEDVLGAVLAMAATLQKQ